MNNITLPKSPSIIKREDNLAVFEINDVFPGYGVTLANALRRVILSSLPGAAITSVKIKNVAHEFSTLANVKEDIVELILNLKQVRFRLYEDQPVKVSLSVKGEKKVTAGDIKAKGQIEVINKDVHIATLTSKNAELEIELTVEKGMGYASPEVQDKTKKEIGVIAVDTVFSPVRKVGYTVENVRVGQRTDYNKIVFEVETDGSITPEEAFNKSVEILIDQFSTLKMSVEGLPEAGKEEAVEGPVEAEVGKVSTGAVAEESVLMKSVDEMGFSNRTLAALKENKMKTVGAITRKAEKDLLEMPKMGKVAVKEIKKELGKLGLVLKQ